jgi:hypothetical protein
MCIISGNSKIIYTKVSQYKQCSHRNVCAYKLHITYHMKNNIQCEQTNPNKRQMMKLRHSTVVILFFQNIQSPWLDYYYL